MLITREYCKKVIDFNMETLKENKQGKYRREPKFTDLTNAQRWLYNLEKYNLYEACTVTDKVLLNEGKYV